MIWLIIFLAVIWITGVVICIVDARKAVRDAADQKNNSHYREISEENIQQILNDKAAGHIEVQRLN